MTPNDQQFIQVLNNFFLTFTSILFEALPWVVLGTALAGVVQEVPSRRSPAVMLALSTLIVALFVSPFDYLLPPDSSPFLLYGLNIGGALVLAAAVLGLLLLAQPIVDSVMHFLGRHRFLSIFASGFLGAVIPMCECGIIPVTRRLLRKGLPLSCCVTYILAGPIVNVVVLLTTYVAFSARENIPPKPGEAYQMGGLAMMGFRALLGYTVAVVTGIIAEFMYRRYGNSLLTPLAMPAKVPVADNEEVGKISVWKSVSNMAETALHDFVDITAFLILGALFAATIKIFLSNEWIAEHSKEYAGLAILIMMGLAIVITLCSEADAFVAANFVTLRPAAKLAFIVLGPMLDFKLFFMYRRVFRPRMMYTIIGAVLIQVFLYCCVTHLFWEKYARPAEPADQAIAVTPAK